MLKHETDNEIFDVSRVISSLHLHSSLVSKFQVKIWILLPWKGHQCCKKHWMTCKEELNMNFMWLDAIISTTVKRLSNTTSLPRHLLLALPPTSPTGNISTTWTFRVLFKSERPELPNKVDLHIIYLPYGIDEKYRSSYFIVFYMRQSRVLHPCHTNLYWEH